MDFDAGLESRTQIRWVIVGGLLLGTVLTLFVVPTAYTLLAIKVTHPEEEPLALPAGGPKKRPMPVAD
jgi:multidrug efflux pump